MQVKIEVIGGPMDGSEFTLSKTGSIGREKLCEVYIQGDRYVSKKHALIRLEKDVFRIDDLGSTNGTFIDDEPVKEPTPLHDGQIFKVGRTLLKIEFL